MSNQKALLTKEILSPEEAEQDALVQPFLKWAGGKRQLLSEIRKFRPRQFGCYFEPFVGAGALLFDLQPQRAVINDTNAELIGLYQVIKESPEQLIELATSYPMTKEAYYEIRAEDRNSNFGDKSLLERAARLIYLNKTCFNGLFRVNSRGQFNVPFGDYAKKRVLDPAVIRAVSAYLNRASVQILNLDFDDSVADAKRGDFVYFDPPYDPLSETSSFTAYSANSFNRDEQQRLKLLCDELCERGCYVLASNSATPFIRELYDDCRYTTVEVKATRAINSVVSGRGKISELLIFSNYEV